MQKYYGPSPSLCIAVCRAPSNLEVELLFNPQGLDEFRKLRGLTRQQAQTTRKARKAHREERTRQVRKAQIVHRNREI